MQGDITDSDLVGKLVAEADAVVHFAAETHVDNALADPEPFLRTNVIGTFTVLEAVRQHGVRLHHVSTDEVYGDLELDDPQRFTEATPYNPSSPYSSTKAARRPDGARVGALLRCAGDDLELLQQLRPVPARGEVHSAPDHQCADRAATQALRSGANVRDWIHVDDHNSAVWRILSDGQIGRTYLIGAEGERDNLTVMRTILRLMDRDPDDFDHVTDRVGHDLRYAIDPSTLRDELGWSPEHTDFEDGLRDTIEWYRANETWWAPLKDAVEAGYQRRGQ